MMLISIRITNESNKVMNFKFSIWRGCKLLTNDAEEFGEKMLMLNLVHPENKFVFSIHEIIRHWKVWTFNTNF